MKAAVHPAALDDEALLAQCDMTKNRSSGPGGQHRNKVESQVHLFHTPTGVSAQAAERRSSHENKRVALRRLRLLLAVEVRRGVPAGDIGSELWWSRVKRAPKGKMEEIFPGVRVRAEGSGAGG
ncbi:MAG: peptide chain release factor-like protein, partial [Phycisphaerae bacterium]|nr:peptide chain release factor-like protein [Phycisphaerae bacterium]